MGRCGRGAGGATASSATPRPARRRDVSSVRSSTQRAAASRVVTMRPAHSLVTVTPSSGARSRAAIAAALEQSSPRQHLSCRTPPSPAPPSSASRCHPRRVSRLQSVASTRSRRSPTGGYARGAVDSTASWAWATHTSAHTPSTSPPSHMSRPPAAVSPTRRLSRSAASLPPRRLIPEAG